MNLAAAQPLSIDSWCYFKGFPLDFLLEVAPFRRPLAPGKNFDEDVDPCRKY